MRKPKTFEEFAKTCVYRICMFEIRKGKVVNMTCFCTYHNPIKKCCPLHCPFWRKYRTT